MQNLETTRLTMLTVARVDCIVHHTILIQFIVTDLELYINEPTHSAKTKRIANLISHQDHLISLSNLSPSFFAGNSLARIL